MPLHDDLQHGAEEPAVPARLVLCAAGDGVRDVAEAAVKADQRGEVGRLQHVNDGHKLGREGGVTAPRNHTRVSKKKMYNLSMRNADTEKPYENKYERLETLKFEEKLFYV